MNLFCQMYIDIYQEHLTNLSLTLVHVCVSVISFLWEQTILKIEQNCFGHFSYVYFSWKGVKYVKLTALLSHARSPPKNNVMLDWARHLS